jgi:CBS domain containing-hemolysin-like protein
MMSISIFASIGESLMHHAIPGRSLAGTLIVCAVLIFIYAIYSGTETGMYRLNHLRLHLSCRKKDSGAVRLDRLMRDQQMLICVSVVGANVCGYLVASVLTRFFEQCGLSVLQIEFWTTIILTPVFAVFCELLPKNCFYARPNTLMLRYLRFIEWGYLLLKMTSVNYVLGFFSRLLLRFAHRIGEPKETMIEWRDMGRLLQEGLISGPLSEFQGGIAERLLRLPEISLNRVIIPLANTFTLSTDVSSEEFLNQVKRYGHSRVPLYQDDPKNIIGVVSVYEVLAKEKSLPPKHFLREVPKISSDLKLIDALELLRGKSARMAVVADRRGFAIGIVTLKDLMDEILGGEIE